MKIMKFNPGKQKGKNLAEFGGIWKSRKGFLENVL